VQDLFALSDSLTDPRAGSPDRRRHNEAWQTPPALQDQELAGALTWFWVTIAYLLPATVSTIRILSPRAGHASRFAEGAWFVQPARSIGRS